MPEFMFERFSLVSPASILNPIFSQKYFPPRFAGFGDNFCFGERKFPRRLGTNISVSGSESSGIV
jgi:hypothetical protein